MPTLKQIARERVIHSIRGELLPMPEYENVYTWKSIQRFVVAQTERGERKFFIVKLYLRDPETGYIDEEDQSYHLLVEYDDLLYEDVGEIALGLDRNRHVANIYSVQLVEEFQHKGLGTFMYKTAINDLVSEGWKVHSDTVRSPQANRLWLNLQQKNPDTVKVLPRTGTTGIFEANGIVHRRPKQPVKRHKRRSK